ncbi:MAG TPA: nucleoside monophosphate kinase [Candidatus Dojkabacteria bacterium]|nr:nucleoside monophosphate kinase [Candidatus Dojkabacteria bacterium]HOF79114.1 nucleoside monophosphate kinase [Candidatus Dojkabacteria bacterium]HOR06131.1 nucleoside monophosphate kinase [Candidatus Dojkabacteria bacterium]HOT60868.1 nucleoside monophosphate kinase [Candidatus Dojkabacteria bacterium]HQI92778.1 nucleoside monophosphate kinase [Candidatus Dojkabacteria bacterium]
MKTILFHGPSGSGKDTQVELLVDKFEIEKIGTGEMFRAMYSEGDIDAIKAYEYWHKGKFVPNDLTYKMFSKWLTKFNQEKDWILVSVVRDIGQVPLLDELLAQYGRKLDVFLHLKLSEEMAIERRTLRWTCPRCGSTYHKKYKKEKVEGYCDKCGMKLSQREDDTLERTKSLYSEYQKTITPILAEYSSRGIVKEIDASPGIEEIHQEIIKQLNL